MVDNIPLELGIPLAVVLCVSWIMSERRAKRSENRS